MTITLDEALRRTAEAVRAPKAELDTRREARAWAEAIVANRLLGAKVAEVGPELKVPRVRGESGILLVILVPGAESLAGASLVAHLRGALARLIDQPIDAVADDKTTWGARHPVSDLHIKGLFGRVNPAGDDTFDVLVDGHLSRLRLGVLVRGLRRAMTTFGDDFEPLALLVGALDQQSSVPSGALPQTRWHGERPAAFVDALAWALRGVASTLREGATLHIAPEVASLALQQIGADRHPRLATLIESIAARIERAACLEERGRLPEAHALLADLFGPSYPIQPPAEHIIALCLDVFLSVPDAIPDAPRPALAFDLDGPLAEPGALDPEAWQRLGDSVDVAVRRARAEARKHPRARVVVAGHAPHAAFIQAGMTLSRWCGNHTLANPRHGDQARWDVMDLSRPIDLEKPAFLDAARGLSRIEPSLEVGRVAVFVGMGDHAVPSWAIDDYFAERDEPLIGLVELCTTQAVLDVDNASAAALEIGDAFRRLRALYPRAYGLALFIAGPAPLAFIVGRAINPNVFGDVWTAHFANGRYLPALDLPWPGPLLPEEQARLTHLSLDGYRGLGDFDLEFDPRLTVLIGANGAGKTSVLDALAMLLGRLFDGLPPDPTHREWSLDDITVSRDRLDGAATLEIGQSSLKLRQGRDLDGPAGGEAPTDTVRRLRAQVRAEPDAVSLPIAVYYTTARSQAASDAPGEPSDAPPWQLRLEAYRGALTGQQTGFAGFFRWFKAREDLENAERTRDPQYRDRPLSAVRRAIADLMPGFHDPRIQRRPLRFCVDKGSTTLTSDQLSSGERGLIALVGDLARRLADANPGRPDPLHGPGIVLIDEVELHLHPGWQRLVLPGLLRAFPGCQLVVTSHSPQVVGHVEADQVRILRRADGRVEVSQPDGAYGLDANRLLEDVFGVDRQPEEIGRRIRELYAHLDAGRVDEARAIYDRLVERIGIPDHPELARARIWLDRMGRDGA